jgi:putative transposase
MAKQIIFTFCFSIYLNTSLSLLVNTIKTATSRIVSNKFESELKKVYWSKKVLWSNSYYISSCGGVAIETLKSYIQEQERPN